MMQQLLPSYSETVDLWTAYGCSPDTSLLRVNMISSLDGAISVNGRSGGLGNETDRRIFALIRAQADVILVGAQTARGEGYGPVYVRPEFLAHRNANGKQLPPPIAVVTNSGELDWKSPFFTEAQARPIVITTRDVAEKVRSAAADYAEVIAAGDKEVHLRQSVDELHARGFKHICCEGGPTLNGALLEEDLIDELCLTIAPLIEQGNGKRIAVGPPRDVPVGFEITQLLEDDGYLYLRLRKR